MPAPEIVRAAEPLMSSPEWDIKAANAVAQLIQVHHRLFASSWADQYSIVGCSNEPMPDIEAVTLPLLLLRQVVGDGLLCAVKEIYRRCLPNSSHTTFLAHHVAELEAALNSSLPTTGETMREFFCAIIYGACLFHAPNRDKKRFDQQAALITRLNDGYIQADIMNDLKYTLDKVWFHVSEAAAVCSMDYKPHENVNCPPAFPMLEKLFRTVDPIRDKVSEMLGGSPLG
jgi:hypothetical protein